MSGSDQGPSREGLKFLPISVSTPGDNTIIAAVAGARIKVSSYLLVVAAAVSVKWKNGATDLSGAMPLGQNGGVAIVAPADSFVLATDVNTALVLNLGSGVQVSGHVGYWDSDAV